MGCVWVYMQKVELRHWWEYGDEKTGINYMVTRKQELKLKIEIETVCISMLSPTSNFSSQYHP